MEDETRIAHVHTRFNGWVETVNVDFTYQHVNEGEPLFSIYSPELVATQQELLLAVKAQQSAIVELHPIRRLGTPEDVASAALFLASDNSAWITGMILDVAGGGVMA
jgi:NAD(P)-dependent dehydrogenase (short-subunit alcohol dehydrogenase family)